MAVLKVTILVTMLEIVKGISAYTNLRGSIKSKLLWIGEDQVACHTKGRKLVIHLQQQRRNLYEVKTVRPAQDTISVFFKAIIFVVAELNAVQ